jgi:hypothetical protein
MKNRVSCTNNVNFHWRKKSYFGSLGSIESK